MVDNIIIYAKDEALHIKHVQQFLQQCQDTHHPQQREVQVQLQSGYIYGAQATYLQRDTRLIQL